MALSRGLGLPTTFYFALWRVRQYAPKKCHAMGHRRQPTLKLMPVLILPLPAGTGYYTRNVQISEDNVLSLSQLFDWFYLPHFLLLQWVVVKYKGVRSPCRFTLVNTTRRPHPTAPSPGRASAVDASRQAAVPVSPKGFPTAPSPALCCSRWSVLLPLVCAAPATRTGVQMLGSTSSPLRTHGRRRAI
jgi:hypothetical protein